MIDSNDDASGTSFERYAELILAFPGKISLS